MAVYVIMIVLSPLFVYMAERIAPKAHPNTRYNVSYQRLLRVIFYFTALMIPVFISGFRYGIGVDWHSYVEIFRWVNQGINTHMEVGFEFLVRVIGFFDPNPLYVFAFVGFMCVFPVLIAIKSHSKNPALSFFIYLTLGYYFSSFNIIRTYMAVAICFWAFRYLKRGNLPVYFAFVIFASLFHVSALIMMPFAFVLRLRLKLSYYVMIAAACLALTLLRNPVLDFMAQNFGGRWSFYRDLFYWGSGLSVYNILMSGLITLGCLAYYKRISEKQGGIVLINTAVYTLVMHLTISIWANVFLSRILVFLTIYHVLTIPEIISCENKESVRLVYNIGIFVVCIAMFLMHTLLLGEANRIFPYQSIFDRA